MSHKVKTVANSELSTCEKYLSKMLRQENFLGKKSPGRSFQDKYSHISKQSAPTQFQRVKTKTGPRHQSPLQKFGSHLNNVLKEHDNVNNVKEHSVSPKRRPRSGSGARSRSRGREAWGQILQSNKSKDKVSTFSNFDPLRTLHFLSKELFTKLQTVSDDDGVLQMVSDIQHALKRIPPEVSTLLHNPLVEYPQSEASGYTVKSTTTKTCQTPPTMYQEDTERFQKIMEENTYRLEASCKQLEIVCANLQKEKEMAEKELAEARNNVDFLCRRVKDLEDEMVEVSAAKIKRLEDEKQHLQELLDKANREINNNPNLNHLKKVVEELKKQKQASDETCARLEYDMTILRMEKEKFVTMLAVRDREIKEIQEEMSKIQDQVNKQLQKLNGDVIYEVNSLKNLSDPFSGLPENLFLEIGDTTLSSITTNDSSRDQIHNMLKESPCGDSELAGKAKKSQDDLLQTLKADTVEIDLPSTNKDGNSNFANIIAGFSPSMKALLTSHNM